MVVEERIRQIPEKIMFQTLLVLLGTCACVTVVTFVLYVRARSKEDTKNENRYKTIHYISMVIFTLLGIWALLILAGSFNYD